MTEIRDIATRTYDYERVQPAVFVAPASGLEMVQRVVDGKLPPPPIMATLDLSFVNVEQGQVAFESSPAEWQYNTLGTMHGGWQSALLDSALGCAVQTTLPPGCGLATLDLHVRFTRPLTAAVDRVRVEARVTHGGKRIVTAEGRIVGPDGKVYATATASCITLNAEP